MTGERQRGARIANALRGESLGEDFFDDVAVAVRNLSTHRFVAAYAPLFEADVVKRLQEITPGWITRHAPRGLLLARLGVLINPRTPGATREERAERRFREAESYRLLLAALVANRLITEAKAAARRARALYRLPAVARRVKHESVLVDLNIAWIAFYQDEIDLALRIIARVCDALLERFRDYQRYAIVSNHHASMLVHLGRYEEALQLLIDAWNACGASGNAVLRASFLHNMSYCQEKLGGANPPETLETVQTMLQQLEMESQIPRTGYLKVEQLRKEGRFHEMVSELYMMRAEFLARGESYVAAATVRAIVDELVPLERLSEAAFIGNPAIEVLESVGMIHEARRIREHLGRPKPRRRKNGAG
jgi:tetratricopeptide (TPR) repeat protein